MSQLIPIFFDILTPVFVLIIVGYFAGPRLDLKVDTLTRLAYFVLIPAFVFDVLSRAEFPAGLAVRMVVFVQGVFILSALAAFVVAKLLKRPPQVVAAYMLIASFANVGNFGLPIIQFHFSRDVIYAGLVRLLVGPAVALLLAIPFGLTGIERGAGVLQASMPVAILASFIALQHDLLPEFVTTTVLFSTLASVVTLTVMLAIV